MDRFSAPTTPEITERERDHAQRVRQLAGECMVLLKNDGSLPLGSVKKLALYGNGARATCKGGTGSGDVYVRETVSVEKGLEQAGIEVTTKAWLDRQDDAVAAERKAYEAAILQQAVAEGDPCRAQVLMMMQPLCPVAMADVTEEDVKNSDTAAAIYVLTRNSGEGKDRRDLPGEYELTEAEIRTIAFLAARYATFAVLLNVGGVVDTKALRGIEGVNAILLMGQLGNASGHIVADVLRGVSLPSGKLTDTWAENYADYPSSATFSSNDGDTNDEYYTEGIFVGYRYFDTFGVKPAYPFGFGLTYTDFALSVTDVRVRKTRIEIDVEVTNVGKRFPGKEVVQVYASAPAGKLPKPYQELRAFAKTRELAPGEKQTLTLRIEAASLASYCAECSCWLLEAGEYVLRVGNSSRNTVAAAVITLDQDVVTCKVRNLFYDPAGPVAEIRPPVAPAPAAEAPFRLFLSAADFETKTVAYAPDARPLPPSTADHRLRFDEVVNGAVSLSAFIADLDAEELAYLCVGNAVDKEGFQEVIGNAAKYLPGSAGETTDKLYESRGLEVMELCDGPAGLRLAPVYVETPNGRAVSLSHFGMDLEGEAPEGVKHYQYLTAIPIATTLASSWNMALIEACGDIVGREMESFGATLWLAPGMNIHRNPLCGRNFEYYSEDPLLSGKCAAADTRGVQRHPGVGTTVKHFLANNQEDNRLFTNSHISERTIREIYVRAFEIAVREAQPMSLMTSYNLVNGVHSANNEDALRYLLRDEWGFEGMVMTDWLTTADMTAQFAAMGPLKYRESDPALCVKAQNDLIEPGMMTDYTRILEGLGEGLITRAHLEVCAGHLLKLMLRTHLCCQNSYYDTVTTEIVSFQ